MRFNPNSPILVQRSALSSIF